jgi:chromosome partitioning protein
MRRIAIINQKGGVGKTTTAANLGSALARLGRRVVVVDLDAQANLSLHLGTDLASGEPSTYDLLLGRESFAGCLKETTTAGLQLLPAHIDLSGAEIELASAFGREILLREAIDTWEAAGKEADGEAPADYVILDCPPSLGLLSINGLAAAHEVIVTLQTEFFALQGISKLVEIVQLMRRRINPNLNVAGILPTLYDTRLKLAREVLAEIRRYFPGQVFSRPIRTNIKLAEAPSHGVSIFEYAPNSPGARDYLILAREIMAAESQDPELAQRDLPVPAVEQLEATLAEMARPPKARPRPRAPEPTTASDSEDPELPTVELTPASALASAPTSAPTSAPEPQAEADADPEWSPADPTPSPVTLPQGSESHDGPGAEPEATGTLTATCDDVAPHLEATLAPAPELTEGRERVADPQSEVKTTAAPLEPKPNYNFAPNNGAERTHMPSRSRLGPLARRGPSGPTCG